MKRTLIIISLLLAATASLCAKEIKEIVFTPSPVMTCENCENRIKGNLRFEKGVKDITTKLDSQEVVITYDAEKTSPENLKKAFGKIGYTVSEKGAAKACDKAAAKACAKKACEKATTTACDKGAAKACDKAAAKACAKKACEKATTKACEKGAAKACDKAAAKACAKKACEKATTKACEKKENCCKKK